jgi:UDP-N-acetyl-D-galactosamine dehydrogenase
MFISLKLKYISNNNQSNLGMYKLNENINIAIIGLGYVGLPLAIEFAKKFKVIGFDIDESRIYELNKNYDRTKEADIKDLNSVVNLKSNKFGLKFSSKISDISKCNIYIITVPTPVDEFKAPDLRPLIKASKMVGCVLKKDDIVIYESTVYPGCTEEICIPELEDKSNLKFNLDFYCGYSPERINPGDKVNTLTKIKKVTSGSTPDVANFIDSLYSSIIKAGTHKAPSIKVAEASKAVENAQRDVNISFVNELSYIFNKIGIDTTDVLEAAGTKWNFLNFKPGLVGGHCIGVDPYYLAHKAESLGYYPQVILSGRRVNDNMGAFIAQKVIKLLIQKNKIISKSKVLILGVTFKENCPDIRNSKVIDIIKELYQFHVEVDVYDPHANKEEVKIEYGLNLKNELNQKYSAIILAVSHKEFLKINYNEIKEDENSIIFDSKSFLDRNLVDARL